MDLKSILDYFSTESAREIDGLLWSDDLGMGLCPERPIDYACSYFNNYRRLDNTEMGAKLTAERVRYVRSFTQCDAVDVGIGGGRFVTEIDGLGYDINPDAVDWLGGRYFDIYSAKADVLTFWDSLEHIPNPSAAINQARHWVFCSVPVAKDGYDARTFKHYKPGEHIWYFNTSGLIRYIEAHGFRCVGISGAECALGRESVKTFAFRRA